MAVLPTVRATGAKSSAAQTVAVAAPAGVATGDLELMFASCIETSTISISAQGGGFWSSLGSAPSVTGSGIIYGWWRIRAGGDSDPSVQASVSDVICAWRVAITTGTFDAATPIDSDYITGTEATSDTSFSYGSGASTVGPNRLCFIVCSSGADSNSGQGATPTNASMASIALRGNVQSSTGGGAGGWAASGTRIAQGTWGTWACTMGTATPKAYMQFAVRPKTVFAATLSSTGTSASTFAAKVIRKATFTSASTSGSTLAAEKYWPPPTTPSIDDFNSGANATLFSRSPPWYASAVSGEATFSTDGVPTKAIPVGGSWSGNYSLSSFAQDQEVWGTFVAPPSGVIQHDLFVRNNLGSPTMTTYVLDFEGTVAYLRRVVAGVSADLTNVTYGFTPAAGDSIWLQAVGSKIRMFYKRAAVGAWRLLIDYTDASPILAAGHVGFDCQDTGVVTWDEIGGGALATPIKDATFASASTSGSTFAARQVHAAASTSASTSASTFAALPFLFPTTPVLDDFNAGANQNLTARSGWNAVTAESGTTSLKTDAAPTAAQTISNLHCSNGWAQRSTDAELWLELGSFTNTQVQLFARMTDTQDQIGHSYLLDYATNGTWSLNRLLAGSGQTNIAQKVGGPVLASGDSFGIRIKGSDFAAFHKPAGGSWRLVVRGTDATYSNSGYIAFLMAATAAVSNVNFVGGSWPVKDATFTSASTSTSAFAAKHVKPAAFTSASSSISAFLPSAYRAAKWDENTYAPLAPGDELHPWTRLGPEGVYQGGYGETFIDPAVRRKAEFIETLPEDSSPDALAGPDDLAWPDFSGGGSVSTTSFSPVVVPHVGGVQDATLSSTATSTSTFAAVALRTAAFTSASTSTTAFGAVHAKPGIWTSASASTSAFNARQIHKAVLSSTGTSTSVFDAKHVKPGAWTSASTSTSAFNARHIWKAALSSTGTSTSAFAARQIHAAAWTSASTSTSAFGAVHARPGAWTSASTSTSSFAAATRRAAAATSAAVGTSTFTPHARRAAALTSAATSTTTFSAKRAKPASFTSASTSTTSFAAKHIAKAALSSTGASTTTFSAKHVNAAAFTSPSVSTTAFGAVKISPSAQFQSDAHSTSTFAAQHIAAAALSSTGASTTSFAAKAIRKATLSSPASSTTSFAASSRRAATWTSAATSTTTFSASSRRGAAFSSTGTSTTVFNAVGVVPGQNYKDAQFASAAPSTTTFTASARRVAALTSSATSTTTFSASGRRGAAFTSPASSTTSFAGVRLGRAGLSSTAASTTTFGPRVVRAVRLTSDAHSTTVFSPMRLMLLVMGQPAQPDPSAGVADCPAPEAAPASSVTDPSGGVVTMPTGGVQSCPEPGEVV